MNEAKMEKMQRAMLKLCFSNYGGVNNKAIKKLLSQMKYLDRNI